MISFALTSSFTGNSLADRQVSWMVLLICSKIAAALKLELGLRRELRYRP